MTEQNRKQIETCQLGDFLGIPTEVYGTRYDNISTVESNYQYYSLATEQFINEYAQTRVGLIDYNNETVNSVGYSSDILSGSENYYSIISAHVTIPAGDLNYNTKLELQFDKLDNSIKYCLMIYDLRSGIMVSNQFIQRDKIIGNKIVLDMPYKFANENDSSDLLFCLGVMDRGSVGSLSVEYNIRLFNVINESVSVSELPLVDLPWRSDVVPSGIPLSALPFRAYEAIYNVFYRNAENNPLLINGVPEYNKWNRSLEGGADTNFYPIMYHNWEDDF